MGINVFVASGNLGKDCELRHTPNGKAIGSFSLAVKSGYGEHEKNSWLMCKIFGKQAEAIAQYLTKGSKVTVTGEFVHEQWEHNGEQKSMNCILVRDVELPAKPQQQGFQPQQQAQQPQQQAPQQQHGQQFNPQQAPGVNQPPIDFSDDVPF